MLGVPGCTGIKPDSCGTATADAQLHVEQHSPSPPRCLRCRPLVAAELHPLHHQPPCPPAPRWAGCGLAGCSSNPAAVRGGPAGHARSHLSTGWWALPLQALQDEVRGRQLLFSPACCQQRQQQQVPPSSQGRGWSQLQAPPSSQGRSWPQL